MGDIFWCGGDRLVASGSKEEKERETTSANPKRQNRRSERASNESGTQTTTQQDLCHHKTLCVERRALRETEVTRLTRALAKSKRKRSFPSSRPFQQQQQQQQQQHGDERGAEEKHELQPQREVHHG